MAVRVTLECGHASMLRVRTTPEGYTHDWEVFVRGVDNADVHQYIDKVVFHLHETFPKPKRVLKEPPYVVKESGYAGFVIPIHIYLKNKDEPKRFQIFYDLQLQQSGPAINNVIRHSEVFVNPSDDFRRKLLKGGAVVVSSLEGAPEKGEAKTTPPMVGKPKLSGSEGKKHRPPEPRTSNSFAELFGAPITPDDKKVSPSEKAVNPKAPSAIEKSEKVEKASKVKHSPHKEGKKEKAADEKKDKKDRDYSKEKDKSKEKSKRPQSPGSKSSHLNPGNKRTSLLVPVKKPPSPLPPLPMKRPLSPTRPKEKESKKPLLEKDKDKEKEKEKPKALSDGPKNEKKKDKKKHKEDRDKERKEKHKERERDKTKEITKSADKIEKVEAIKQEKVEKLEKTDKQERIEKEKSQESKSLKDDRKSPKILKETEKVKEEKSMKFEKSEKGEKSEKTKDGKNDKERQKQRNKHKKKDKKDRREGSKEREKKEKRERGKGTSEKQNSLSAQSSTNPLSTLLAEMPDRDSSDSVPSPDDDSFSEAKSLSTVKKEPESLSVPSTETATALSPSVLEIKKERSERNKKERSRGNRGEERESKKRKRRSESKGDDEPVIKREKEREHSSSPPLEPVSSSQSPVAVDVEAVQTSKDKEERGSMGQVSVKGSEGEGEQVAPDSTNNTLTEPDVGEPPVFSEDYVLQLKDLQQKIMTLQDNQELQRVVQVIAETGQYEITKKTFDFDLCALDRRTVQRLQQFFAS